MLYESEFASYFLKTLDNKLILYMGPEFPLNNISFQKNISGQKRQKETAKKV